MTTKELKSYIERILGNSIRCLLPSYWWKRMFGLVVDRVEEGEEKLNAKINAVSAYVQKNTAYIPEEGEVLSGWMIEQNAIAVDSVKGIDDIVFVFDGGKQKRSANLIYSSGSYLRYIDGLILKESIVYADGTVTTSIIASLEGESYDDTELRNELSGKATKDDVASLSNEMVANEEVTAAALNELNERINAISENVSGETATKVELQNAVESLTNTILENEEVTAAALNDLKERVENAGSIGDLDLSTYATKQEVADNLAGKQDKLVSGTNIKTINGQSLLGSGNITIEGGGGSSGGSGAYAEVNHGTSDTIFTLTPNTFHVWDEVASLTLTLGSEQSGVANEYVFQFTSGATATSLTLPDDIKWANDSAPTIAENKIYQISVLKGLASCLEFNNAEALIENLVSVVPSGTRYNLELQYPSASNIKVFFSNYESTSVSIPAGTTSYSLGKSLAAPVIIAIDPISDNTYIYTW